jgi:cytochrome c peroxidase
MKKFIFVFFTLLGSAGISLFSCKQKQPAQTPEKTIARELLAEIDRFDSSCKLLQTSVENHRGNEKQLQQLFLQTRLAYKRFEWAAEYFVPATSRIVNGPPVEEVEMSGQVLHPGGLQVIESLLFPGYDTANRSKLIQQLKLLQSDGEKYRIRFANIDIFDWQVFDAARLEIFRIITLGITGFDNPLTQKSASESAASLDGLKKVLAHYTDSRDSEKLLDKLEAAAHYLGSNTDFNSLDRAAFITGYGNPITISLSDLEARLKIQVIKYNRLLNQEAKTLFDTNAFNVNAYAPDPASFLTPEKVALGKMLFSDPGLSGNGIRSCQSCHQPEKAFTDGLVKNTMIDNNQLLARNTPTLLNAALQPSLFYDLRVGTLEDQSLSVVQNISEMHGSMVIAVKRLWQNKTYRSLFAKAFPQKDRTGIDTLEVMNAIGSYVRSLVSLNSRFDEYMRGNKAAMSAGEISGFNLFMGKAKCATCHYIPLFNGTFPPRFIKTEAEVIGVPGSPDKPVIDPDMGRYNIIRVASFRHAFKTPTLRNAEKTSPYMHNGVFSSLAQVMDFYNKGGGRGMGIKIDNQTLPFDKLNLTQKEQRDIIGFIRSLNSR